MKTLLFSKPPPSLLPKLSQTNLRSPTLYSTTKQWKLNSNGKGFASLKETPKDKKLKKKKVDDDNNEQDEPIPDAVYNKMITRILISVGVPLTTGLVLLNLLGFVQENKLVDVPKWLPFLTTLITFGASTLGIAYGSLSTSWESDNEGSLLGFEEAKQNWAEMWKEEDNM